MQDNKPKTRRASLGSILALLGPGLFLIGYNIGTGSVTTMASAGSRWGMQLTWIVLLSCVFVFFGIALFGRYTLATGETILYAMRRHFRFGGAIGLFIMASVILGEFAGMAGTTFSHERSKVRKVEANVFRHPFRTFDLSWPCCFMTSIAKRFQLFLIVTAKRRT